MTITRTTLTPSHAKRAKRKSHHISDGERQRREDQREQSFARSPTRIPEIKMLG
jgi:hypothetical protein